MEIGAPDWFYPVVADIVWDLELGLPPKTVRLCKWTLGQMWLEGSAPTQGRNRLVLQGGLSRVYFNPSTSQIEMVSVTMEDVSVAGEMLDCNGEVSRFPGISYAFPLHPQPEQSSNWHWYSLEALAPPVLSLTRAYHPLIPGGQDLSLASLQYRMDMGSDMLAFDDDNCYPDWAGYFDPNHTNYDPVLLIQDDHRVHYEFLMQDHYPVHFSGEYADLRYLNPATLQDVFDILFGVVGANIKQVNSLPPGIEGTAFGSAGMVVEVGAPPIVLMHEWLHTLGLTHSNRSGALMHPYVEFAGPEVNRWELP